MGEVVELEHELQNTMEELVAIKYNPTITRQPQVVLRLATQARRLDTKAAIVTAKLGCPNSVVQLLFQVYTEATSSVDDIMDFVKIWTSTAAGGFGKECEGLTASQGAALSELVAEAEYLDNENGAYSDAYTTHGSTAEVQNRKVPLLRRTDGWVNMVCAFEVDLGCPQEQYSLLCAWLRELCMECTESNCFNAE